MVQNVVRPLGFDVIKVTIKDKPAALQRQNSEENLRKAFDGLVQYAKQERRIKNLRTTIENRSSKRKLRSCFETWRNRAAIMRTASERSGSLGTGNFGVTGEARIELLVGKIAEKQRQLAAGPPPPPPSRNKEPIRRRIINRPVAKSAPPAAPSVVKTQNRAVPTALTKPPQPPTTTSSASATVKSSNNKRMVRSSEEAPRCLEKVEQEVRKAAERTIDVARQALNQCDRRTRRSLVHLMREQGCRDKSIMVAPQIPDPPKFLMRMEARAEARKQRMKLAEQVRQRKREEEKKKEELYRQKLEEEERLQQIQAFKEVKKQRKEHENRRLREIEKNQKLEYIADQFYKRYLFRRYILQPLNNIVEERHKRIEKANQHYEVTLLIKIFSAWKNEWIDQQKAKLQLANKLYRHNLLWYAFDDWKTFTLDMKQKYQVAVDFHDMKLQGKCLKAWYALSLEIKVKVHEKEVKALKHYERHLRLIYFNLWRQYMSIADDIKEREQRRDEWRDLIKKFIPDTPSMRLNGFLSS